MEIESKQKLLCGAPSDPSTLPPTSLPVGCGKKHIVSKLDTFSEQVKKLEAIYTQKLAHLEELQKSVLQKVLRGTCSVAYSRFFLQPFPKKGVLTIT